jgi:biopolymer transport protein TolR
MALAKRNEGANVSSDINVTPMVDVMLVLLIIFMVVTPMLQHGVPVDMAKVNNPDGYARRRQRRRAAGCGHSR